MGVPRPRLQLVAKVEQLLTEHDNQQALKLLDPTETSYGRKIETEQGGFRLAPALTPEQLQLVETWVDQGRPQ